MSFYQKLNEELNTLSQMGIKRTIVPKVQHKNLICLNNDRCSLVNLSSNDYLGLAQDQNINDEFINLLKDLKPRFSSSGSPLLTGAHESYGTLKNYIEELYAHYAKDKRALLFNSGFDANSGILAALGDKDTLVIADKLSHASIIDGMRLGENKFLRYHHNNFEHLEKILYEQKDNYKNIIIVTEAIFSMDGDSADLDALVSLKNKFKSAVNIILYLDEAHSFGVRGFEGLGMVTKSFYLDKIDIVLCTLGKAAGSHGAFVLCNSILHDYLINKVRPLIFSTALPPAQLMHIRFMLDKLVKADDRREKLQNMCSLISKTTVTTAEKDFHCSQIIPFMTYTESETQKALNFFREHGFYLMPIRYPTVPKGKSRLRISLSAAVPLNDIQRLNEAILNFNLNYAAKNTN